MGTGWNICGVVPIQKSVMSLTAFEDCMEGKIDMVITKSISRFAQNTLDCLNISASSRIKIFRYSLKREHQFWRCVSRLEEKGSDCSSPTVNEETLQTAVVKAINEVLCSKDIFILTLQNNITTVLNKENDKATDDIEGKLDELQNELLWLANSKADYNNVANEIYRLRELKQNTLEKNAERQGKRQRIAEMTEFLNEQSGELKEYDE